MRAVLYATAALMLAVGWRWPPAAAQAGESAVQVPEQERVVQAAPARA